MKKDAEIVIIGISGVTCGGKSTLANSLKKSLEEKFFCVLFGLDDYYKDEADVPIDPESGFHQWDTVKAFHLEKCHQDVFSSIEKIKQSKPDDKKVKGIVIIEGILVFRDETLNELFDKRYFLTLPYAETEKRRKLRVYDPPDIPGLFEGHVWPMYEEYRDYLRKQDADMVEIDATQSTNDVLSFVLNDLKSKILADQL